MDQIQETDVKHVYFRSKARSLELKNKYSDALRMLTTAESLEELDLVDSFFLADLYLKLSRNEDAETVFCRIEELYTTVDFEDLTRLITVEKYSVLYDRICFIKLILLLNNDMFKGMNDVSRASKVDNSQIDPDKIQLYELVINLAGLVYEANESNGQLEVCEKIADSLEPLGDRIYHLYVVVLHAQLTNNRESASIYSTFEILVRLYHGSSNKGEFDKVVMQALAEVESGNLELINKLKLKWAENMKLVP